MTVSIFVVLMLASDWLSSGGDAQRTGLQKADEQISKFSVKNFKPVLRRKLGSGETLRAPLIIGRLISYKGFKELAIVAGSSGHVWAIDADRDLVFWERQLPGGSGSCGRVAMPAMMPAPETGPARNAPRAIFVVAGDGKLYRLNPSTGEDLAAPVDFLPTGANAGDLAVANNVVYTATDGTCGAPKADWSINAVSGSIGHEKLARSEGAGWTVTDGPKTIVAREGSRQAWASREMVSPEPPVAANGVVFTVAADGLHAFDALTGEEIYSATVDAPPSGTGLAVANGRVWFTTSDGTLRAFGVPMNRD